MVIIVMGVAGSGKTTVGELLAEEIGCHYYDADDFHPAANIEKMEAGKPLTDEDRLPWLEALHSLVDDHLRRGRNAVIACSALKQKYRQRLGGGEEEVKFVYLKGSVETIRSRLKLRKGHFMKSNMLESQFDDLEEPDDAWVIDVERDPQEIVQTILKNMSDAQGT